MIQLGEDAEVAAARGRWSSTFQIQKSTLRVSSFQGRSTVVASAMPAYLEEGTMVQLTAAN